MSTRPLNSSNDSVDLGASGRYAALFQGADAVVRYKRKLDNNIDKVRHSIECQILSRFLKGSVFDCTIGVGRFLGALPGVTRIDGMDLSHEFVKYTSTLSSNGNFFVGDLTKAIPVRSGTYDNVICLRSLSGIGRLATILPELVRIVRPEGFIVIDYGRRATISHVKGVKTLLDGEDVEEVIGTLDVDVFERAYLDAFLTRAKTSDRAFRFLTGSGRHFFSGTVLLALERLFCKFWWQRQIIVLRRRPS